MTDKEKLEEIRKIVSFLLDEENDHRWYVWTAVDHIRVVLEGGD